MANACGMNDTAKLLGTIQPDAVLALGDNQYPSGALADYEAVYADSWGAYRDITFPVPGNHEYSTPSQAATTPISANARPEPDAGTTAHDLGAWHLIALNSECDHVGGCAVARTLRAPGSVRT
jgi:hypothetical protein